MASALKFKMTWLIFFIVPWTFSCCQEDSLRSALNAIDRRQRDLSEYDEGEFGYPLEHPDDLAFLKGSGYNTEHAYDKGAIIGRPLINYIDDDRYNSDDVNTRISSAFRERIEEDNQKQLDELTRDLISNGDNRGIYDGENEEFLRELWEKYRRPYGETKMYPKFEKRDYYPQLGLDAIGLRKRNSGNHYSNEELEDIYAHTHNPREDDFDDDYDDNFQLNYLRKRYQQRENKMNMIRQMYSNPYSQIKRFPVTKRSSNYGSLENTHEQKRSVRKQTDPKVEKELSNIFGTKDDDVTPTKAPATTTKAPEDKKDAKNKQKPKNGEDKKNAKTVNKEQLSPIPSASDKPLQIKKKSIDWSDYFGLDRRKKSDRNDLDKEWLIERYHKSIALPPKKRTAEIPLSSFRNHDDPSKKEFGDDLNDEKEKLFPEEQKINDMDTKLKMLEDKIVDDALKYTGAHEGETDPKEIQDVKDRVISRLAEAYSLEKMRNALNEYKLSVAKEREKFKQRRPEEEEYMFSEEKRVAVPRKQVIDSDREIMPEADNNIKCTDGEKCHEQNYRTPSDILESHFGTKECPAIQVACNEIASAIGQYGEVFKSACNMHEMCLLCGDNSWFSPTRQCNALFLAKAYDLCKGNLECQRAAQGSIPYLLDVNRSLHTQGISIDDCELSCPETDIMANASDTR